MSRRMKVLAALTVPTIGVGMVHPVIPYGIKGVIWYQGETNAMISAAQYGPLFEAMVTSWRKQWDKAGMPFYFAQLASHDSNFKHWVGICDVQRRLLRLKNTGMAVLIDIGEAKDIHPKNKMEVGKRLALWALKHDYHQDIPVWSGPLYRSHQVKGGGIVVMFDHAGSGLMAGRKELLEKAVQVDEPLKLFEIASVDGQWKPAHAEIISKNTVRVWSEDVLKPTRVRYAWKANPKGANLYNKEGLPASLFTTEPHLRSLHRFGGGQLEERP